MDWILISFSMSIFLHYDYMSYMFIFHRGLFQDIIDTSLSSHFSLSSLVSFLIPILSFREHMYRLIRIRSLFSPAPTYPANKKTPATILICSRMHSAHAIRASRRTSIFRVSSRWQFSRGWWRQTTTGCADAPEMSSRGKVPRCWK